MARAHSTSSAVCSDLSRSSVSIPCLGLLPLGVPETRICPMLVLTAPAFDRCVDGTKSAR